MDSLWPLMIIVFFANTVESLAGFGATVLALTFGAQFFAIEDLIPILLPLNLILSLTIVIRYWESLNRKELLTRILPFALVGMPIGIAIYQLAPGKTLKLVFGVVVVLLGLFELTRAFIARGKPEMAAKKPSLLQSATFLISGGIMQGLYASGGPFIVYYASRAIPDKREFRTTLSALWLILNFFLTGTLIATNKMTSYTLKFSLYLLPCVVAGMIIGMLVHDRVSEKSFRTAVYVLLVGAGLSLLWRSL